MVVCRTIGPDEETDMSMMELPTRTRTALRIAGLVPEDGRKLAQLLGGQYGDGWWKVSLDEWASSSWPDQFCALLADHVNPAPDTFPFNDRIWGLTALGKPLEVNSVTDEQPDVRVWVLPDGTITQVFPQENFAIPWLADQLLSRDPQEVACDLADRTGVTALNHMRAAEAEPTPCPLLRQPRQIAVTRTQIAYVDLSDELGAGDEIDIDPDSLDYTNVAYHTTVADPYRPTAGRNIPTINFVSDDPPHGQPEDAEAGEGGTPLEIASSRGGRGTLQAEAAADAPADSPGSDEEKNVTEGDADRPRRESAPGEGEDEGPAGSPADPDTPDEDEEQTPSTPTE